MVFIGAHDGAPLRPILKREKGLCALLHGCGLAQPDPAIGDAKVRIGSIEREQGDSVGLGGGRRHRRKAKVPTASTATSLRQGTRLACAWVWTWLRPQHTRNRCASQHAAITATLAPRLHKATQLLLARLHFTCPLTSRRAYRAPQRVPPWWLRLGGGGVDRAGDGIGADKAH